MKRNIKTEYKASDIDYKIIANALYKILKQEEEDERNQTFKFVC